MDEELICYTQNTSDEKMIHFTEDTSDDEELRLLSQERRYRKHLKQVNPTHIEWLYDNFQ